MILIDIERFIFWGTYIQEYQDEHVYVPEPKGGFWDYGTGPSLFL